jgi:hypothetical protein
MAQRFVDFETKICADWLNTVDDAVFDALGTPRTPDEARQNIGAIEEAPNDGTPYVRKNLAWLAAAAALAHNELGGRSDPDTHPQTAITGLNGRLTNIEAKNTSQDAEIALKADKTYVDSQDANLQSQITANDGDIATLQSTKADITYVDSQNNAQNLVIAQKADTSYVDSENVAQTAELLGLIIALG